MGPHLSDIWIGTATEGDEIPGLLIITESSLTPNN